MSKPILIIAAFTICTAIILGAMAAHGLGINFVCRVD
jgi:uncharacterized membrane protein YgdD (TMEM256/DUF423 family)